MIRKEIKFVLLGILIIGLLSSLFFYGFLSNSTGKSITPQPSCGNNYCDVGEESTCPGDCAGPENLICGDGKCDTGEESSCPNDCLALIEVPRCGDGNCNNNETCSTCSGDCGGCPRGSCPNGVCDVGEDSSNCPADCGQEEGSSCGDTICGTDETSINCPADCHCGNGVCDSSEDALSCPVDCETPISSICGNNYCEFDETPINCPTDCELISSICGNNYCESNETPINCPTDCFIQENPPANSEICDDTDMGINYLEKGTVSYQGENIDNCIGKIIEEYYCTEGGHLGIYHYSCPNGCFNGACIETLSQSPSDCAGEDCNKNVNFFTKVVDFFKGILP